MKKTLSLLLLAAMTLSAAAQSTVRKFVLKNSDDGKSELTVYLPSAEAAAKANGMAVVDCPGGGYIHLSMQNEGHDWAEFFNAKGIAYIVLQYRMPEGNRNIPLSDAYNAMRTVRDSAAVWHVNPRAVGIMGFSAGGHLASSVSTHARYEERPDFSILFYPVISMVEKETHKGSVTRFMGDGINDKALQREWSNHNAVRRHLTPPAIILLANDDRAVPPVTNGVAYYNAMRRAGNLCEMHIYPTGGHGFGFKASYKYHDRMLADLSQWLKDVPLPAEKDVKVACIGNSITDGHGIDMAEQLSYPALLRKHLGKGYEVRNFGVSSRTLCSGGDRPYIREMAWRDAQAYNPDIVVIKLGTNDTKAQNLQVAQRDFAKDYQAMIDTLKALPSKPKIYLCTPIPAFKDTWSINDSVIVNLEIPAIQRLAKKNKLRVIDLHSLFADQSANMQRDGIHPNEKGAARLAELVADALKEEKK